MIPFNIHGTHGDVIELGGYAGCLRCGRIASTANTKNRLAQECRQECPIGRKGRDAQNAKRIAPYGLGRKVLARRIAKSEASQSVQAGAGMTVF